MALAEKELLLRLLSGWYFTAGIEYGLFFSSILSRLVDDIGKILTQKADTLTCFRRAPEPLCLCSRCISPRRCTAGRLNRQTDWQARFHRPDNRFWTCLLHPRQLDLLLRHFRKLHHSSQIRQRCRKRHRWCHNGIRWSYGAACVSRKIFFQIREYFLANEEPHLRGFWSTSNLEQFLAPPGSWLVKNLSSLNFCQMFQLTLYSPAL